MRKLIVEFEIEADEDNALHVVESLLDAGYLQDAINAHEVADCGDLRVINAEVREAE